MISCDKVEKPYKEVSNVVPTDTGSHADLSIRKVIIEDFTGHTCGNCPEAHREVQQLVQLYGEKLIPIAIHCGFFSKPKTSGIKYLYDFRTETGNYYGGDGSAATGFYNIQSYPTGLVNSVSPDKLAAFSTWGSTVDSILDTKSKIGIEIESTCDTVSKSLSVKIKTSALEDQTLDIYLITFVVEDSIVNWQTDYSLNPAPDVSNYLHRHVLRKGLSNPMGDQIKNGPFPRNTFIEKEFSINYAGKDWVSSRLYIVAFVYDFATKEILQAGEKKVI